ncbi:hypothetical protein ACHAWF_016022 [Thalassiosira exigua]
MWDLKCLAAAACFLTSNILFVVHGVLMMKQAQSDQASNANDGSGGTAGYMSGNAYDPAKEQSVVKPMSFHYEYWKDLDPVYIESRWVDREQSRPIMMSAALFGALAWFWLMVPIVQSAWVLSRGGKRLVGTHAAMAGMAICGSIIEFMSRLMIVGMTNASQWLAKDFNLSDWDSDGDGTGWRVLEMIHIITRGMVLWIDAFEALALFGIVVVIFYSVGTEPKFKTKRNESIVVQSETEDADAASGLGERSLSDSTPGAMPPASAFTTTKVPIKRTFSKWFTWYGLFVGLLALADFAADVLRFMNWNLFGRIAMATNILLGVIFLPLWLIFLACQLPSATDRFEREARRAAVLLDAEGDETAALKAGGGEMS